MKIQLWAVGKNHDPSIKSGIDDFTDRLGKYYPAEWKIFPPLKNAARLPEPELKKKEGELIIGSLQKTDWLVALDERGSQLDSVELSQFIVSRANESTRNLVFLIGGAYGLHESVMTRSNWTWSLSKLTFPHQLVRLLLAEQLYRACSIARGEKYHHS